MQSAASHSKTLVLLLLIHLLLPSKLLRQLCVPRPQSPTGSAYTSISYFKYSITALSSGINKWLFFQIFLLSLTVVPLKEYVIVALLYTVKPGLSSHSKIDKPKGLKTNCSLMKVKSIAECSLGAFCNSILQYF